MRWFVSKRSWAILLVVTATAGLLRGEPGQDAAETVATLIQLLGDDAYAKREAAGKRLEKWGEIALPPLRNAAATNADLEIRQRAARLVRTIMAAAGHSKSTGLKMVPIDAGEFKMGSPISELGRRTDEPLHRVRITRPFLLGMFEVTQEEFSKVMPTNPSSYKVAIGDIGRFPVESVTWFDAVEFCNRLSKLDGFGPYYHIEDAKREGDVIKSARVTLVGGKRYRLPTEAEWEYACRAGTSGPFCFGIDPTLKAGEANCKSGPVSTGGYGSSALKWRELGRTNKVGSYAPNGWGLYDMHGNVGEWCWDWYDKDYYSNSPTADPTGPGSGHQRVQRGGSWIVNETNCRSASRFWHTPDESKNYGGVRVARTP